MNLGGVINVYRERFCLKKNTLQLGGGRFVLWDREGLVEGVVVVIVVAMRGLVEEVVVVVIR